MEDVVPRRRRVFGPTHPDTIWAVDALSKMREAISNV